MTKFIASLFSGSSSMLAESVRWPTLTTSCCFCSVDARPKRAADTQHPFGYGYGYG
ncbi:hypothetical protein [Mycetocola sp.]|uniref:hypothetical protein n=1 Tax=Mycetocola sp. TaxID=1871042 RepID=UPI00345BEE31